MGSNIFSIGLSALSAAQVAQKTTGHNLANATTEGYNRQIVSMSTAGAIGTGAGFIGMGTQVSGINRAYNDLLNKQVLGAETLTTSFESYHQKIKQLDDIVADRDAGLSPVLQEFFASWHNLSSDTSMDSSRQSVISNTETLVARIRALGDVTAESLRTVNGEVTSSVTKINSLSQQIASLNEQITRSFGAGEGHPPNDLLDQRDQTLHELNKIIKVTTVKEDDRSVSVFFGTGQPLVMGMDRSLLTAVPNPHDPSQTQVSYQFKTGNPIVVADKLLVGGSLGGIMQYRSETLMPAINSMGRIALSIAEEFNNQHKLGVDKSGLMGKDLFSVGNPTVYHHPKNAATSNVAVSIVDTSKLTTSDYRLQFDGTNYNLTRLSDNTRMNHPVADFPLTIDGMEIQAPTMNAGESFTIKPTAHGSTTLKQLIFAPSEIAAAAPIVTSGHVVPEFNLNTTGNTGSGRIIAPVIKDGFVPGTQLNFTFNGGNMSLTPAAAVTVAGTDGSTTNYPAGTAFPWAEGATVTAAGVSFVMGGLPNNGDHFNFSPVRANLGTGVISAGSVDKDYLTTPLAAGTVLEFTYDGTNNTFTPGAGVGAIVVTQLDGTTTNYAAGTAFPYHEGAKITTQGMSFNLTGTPVNGDRFSLTTNANGIGDNRNSQLLANLQTKDTIGGLTSFQGAYSTMVSFIGNKTSEVTVLGSAEGARMEALIMQQQSEQGVNQDEELANMIMNQHAYQAATKVIQAGSDMFDAILSIR